jgi:hypothetical protein
MNVSKLIDLIFLPLEKTLNCIGAILNQMPSPDELKKIKVSPRFKSSFPVKMKTMFDVKNSRIKKKDSRPKGTEHSETQIFNKPRH